MTTYTVTKQTYAEANKRQGGMSQTVCMGCDTLEEARRIARKVVHSERGIYRCEIFDEGTADYVYFKPAGQRVKSTLGKRVGEVIKHWVYPNARGWEVFYYPDFSYSPNKRMSHRKYILKADGTLGRGYE